MKVCKSCEKELPDEEYSTGRAVCKRCNLDCQRERLNLIRGRSKEYRRIWTGEEKRTTVSITLRNSVVEELKRLNVDKLATKSALIEFLIIEGIISLLPHDEGDER